MWAHLFYRCVVERSPSVMRCCGHRPEVVVGVLPGEEYGAADRCVGTECGRPEGQPAHRLGRASRRIAASIGPSISGPMSARPLDPVVRERTELVWEMIKIHIDQGPFFMAPSPRIPRSW